jgi:hypothetical protein
VVDRKVSALGLGASRYRPAQGSGRVGSLKGEGVPLGAGGAPAAAPGIGTGGDVDGAAGAVPGDAMPGVAAPDPDAGPEITGAARGAPGIAGATPMVGITPYPPGTPGGA